MKGGDNTANIHYFDIEIARQFGIISAVILSNIVYWIRHNEANGLHFHDGRYWTFNTVKAFNELFPYLTTKQIRAGIQVLIDNGILVTGNYNEKPFDHTLWYAIGDAFYTICPTGQIELPYTANRIAPQGNAIPYINTDNKQKEKDTNVSQKKFVPPSVEDVRQYCKERNSLVDPEAFVDFYSSKGWMVGKNHMKDWKAAVRTWERSEGRNGNKVKINMDWEEGDDWLK